MQSSFVVPVSRPAPADIPPVDQQGNRRPSIPPSQQGSDNLTNENLNQGNFRTPCCCEIAACRAATPNYR